MSTEVSMIAVRSTEFCCSLLIYAHVMIHDGVWLCCKLIHREAVPINQNHT